MPAPAGMDAGTASQLIPGVGPTLGGAVERRIGVAVLLILAAGATAVVAERPLMRIVVAAEQPVRVLAIRDGDEPGALVVEVENHSQKSVWSAAFLVSPADCARSGHPAAKWLAFPDDAPSSRTPQRTLEVGARTKLLLLPVHYQQMLRYQLKAGCPEEARPDIFLRTVAFCDGTGWEGFADGPEHTVWAGRAWSPPQKPQCQSGRGPTRG